MRKEADFDVMDHITVYVSGNDKITDLILKNKDEISGDVLADGIAVDSACDGYSKEWDINGEKVTLGVKKI